MTQAHTGLAAPDRSKAVQILAAAKEMFLRDGFERTSMDVVAREAGVSKATLYAHFASKDRLFASMVTIECQRHLELFDRLEAEHPSIREALLAIARAFARFLMRPEVLKVHRLVVAEAHSFPALARAYYEAGPMQMQGVLARFLGAAVARGELVIPDVDLAADFLLSLVKGLPHFRGLLEYGTAQTQAEQERLVAAAVDLFISGYRPG